MTTPTAHEAGAGSRSLIAHRRSFASVAESDWDRLADATPWATPFSRHCVQKAWWEAYGATAHDETVVVTDGTGLIAGIAPLMHRHELEPGDLAARTALRHEPDWPIRPVPDSATGVFFGASYHADYATVLAAPADLPAVCDAVAQLLTDDDPGCWDVLDLRRLRLGDPAADELSAAFDRRGRSARLRAVREVEDVCPIITLPDGVDFDGYLGTLGKKERHEIRRKLRRAEAAGPVALERSTDPAGDLDAFVELHQKRWGADGLFPPTEGGAASRRFFAGLFSDCARTGLVDLSFLTVGGRRVAAGVTLDDGNTTYYYNAGVEPEARELSPGVVMVACYVQRAIAQGRSRVDFLRGNEPYKYEWGAVDVPIERLLVLRTEAGPEAD
jgi:CelD/BcsL family acetyltransferase involved in cellulose biosynthesis